MRITYLLALTLIAIPLSAFSQDVPLEPDEVPAPGYGTPAVMQGAPDGGVWSVVCPADGGACELKEGAFLPEVHPSVVAGDVKALLSAAKDGKLIFAIVILLRLLLWAFIALLRLRTIKPLIERVPALKKLVAFLDNDWAYWALPLGLSVTSALISWLTVPNTAALEDVLLGSVILGLAAAGKTPTKAPEVKA